MQRNLQESMQQMQELQQSLQCQQLELDCISSLGEEILSTCHPDAVVTIRTWLSAAKSRFQEVFSLSQQLQVALLAQQRRMEADRDELLRLQLWVAAAEEALRERDLEPIPDLEPALRELSRQHQEFMEELGRMQDDVDKATKGCREQMMGGSNRTGAARRSSPKAALHPQCPQMQHGSAAPGTLQLPASAGSKLWLRHWSGSTGWRQQSAPAAAGGVLAL
ncbi:microtubule-actin cross-linking factor 1-like isoform X2 [Coturnix japonica]|uniref:microtubule-actin cross-linking factor 1-like isoform X2 n=1 Tax=Coturnix japonica TaxID=93934 RepID=UPI0013A5E01A|nr:microtubule-actin cross-linking factor 1-like isoform X2 [Coturnix japonica]